MVVSWMETGHIASVKGGALFMVEKTTTASGILVVQELCYHSFCIFFQLCRTALAVLEFELHTLESRGTVYP